MPPVDEYQLLCERCGYVIGGLDESGACPECGRPIAESLPQRRRGTAAQIEPTLGALLRTALDTALHRRAIWREVRIGFPTDDRMRRALLFGAAALVAMHASILQALGLEQRLGSMFEAVSVAIFLLLPLWTMVAWLVLAALTEIERIGVQIFGRMHGRRITPAIATTIVSHASAGWLVGAVLLTPAWLAGRLLASAADHIGLLRWELVFALPWLLPSLAAGAGLLLFETITYHGVLRLRYANRERPEPAP
ncbi:MAG: hypothetical protein ACF8R7_07675 [Phycisphaerales bacterium JB039]